MFRTVWMTLRLALIAACAAVTVAAGVGMARADAFSDGAGKFIESLADKAIEALVDKSVARETRVERFRSMLHDNFALPTIGRFVLGRHWNTATEAERTEFMTLFEELMVISYVDRFTEYAGEKLTVARIQPVEDGEAMVSSVIARPRGGDPIKVDWRVRGKDEKYKIIDVVVEGVSMGQTQRSEFASVIRHGGGKIGSLIAELRKKVGKET